MTLLAACFIFTVIMAAAVIIIISDNKTKRVDKNDKNITKSDNEINTNVYDGVPLYRCSRCGSHAVVVSILTKNKDLLFYARCKECGRSTETNEDLGFVINTWNCNFGTKPKDIMGPPMKL